ncbi:hypothetical protein [Streptomyces sp. NPDC097981]|uniref:hypothetical protein n=1 Tax=Streptomyces sp. NPDC097981 TaxID=3155428 RepID=UPI003334A7C6
MAIRFLPCFSPDASRVFIALPALGLLATLAEASTGVKDALQWSGSVGPLSGKTSLAVAVWLLAWAVLHAVLRNKPYETVRALPTSLVLIALGGLGAFPEFFQLFS